MSQGHALDGTSLGIYEVRAQIGRGGMGEIYLASDARLRRPVALKVLPERYAQDERFRELLLRESRLAASLDHPSVVPVYDAGEADGRLFIAMRYVDGVDLRTLLREAAPLAPERVVGIAAQLAEALDAAHQRGLVHRDVRPSNVLLDQRSDRDHAYLADFGLTHSPATAAPRTGSSWAPSSTSDQGVERRDDTALGRLDALPLGERSDTLHVRRTNRARVVDQHVERTEAPLDLRERGIDRRAVADVRLDGEAGAEFVENLLGRSDAHVHDGHRRALGGERAADPRADA